MEGSSAAIQSWLNKTLIIIVLYKLELKRSQTFNTLMRARQDSPLPCHLFIYDNSPLRQSIDVPQDISVEYVHDPENSGVSKAYNVGSVYAKNTDKDWLLLLDQDTEMPPDFWNIYHRSLLQFPNEVCFVPVLQYNQFIFSPYKIWIGGATTYNSVPPGVMSFRNANFVNSGLLISLEAFDSAQGYDEQFPLDFSDCAFCERLRKHYSTFVVAPVSGQHEHSSLVFDFKRERDRFTLYSQAATRFGKRYATPRLVKLRTFMRSVSLTWKYRNPDFIRICMGHFFL
jgi:GT2 family glycosyltransferase